MTRPKPTGNVAGPRRPRKKPAAEKPVAVTYRGPTNPKDKTRRAVVSHFNPRHDEIFPLDQTVRTTKSTASRLAAMAGHTFTIEPAEPEGGM